MAYKIRMAELSIEKAKIEIHKLLSSGDPLEAIDAEEKELGIILTERTLAGARMELEWLREIAAELLGEAAPTPSRPRRSRSPTGRVTRKPIVHAERRDAHLQAGE